jgi:hypothetical protein
MIPKLTLKTKDEFDALVVFLDIIERKLYKKEVLSLTDFKEEWGSYSWFDSVLKAFEQEMSGKLESGIPFIKELLKWARGLEQVKLVIPFKPTQDFIDRIYSEVGPSEPAGFLLDILVDKNMLSGGKMFHRGRYTDLTLKPKLENYFSKEDVLEKYL